MWCKFYSWLYPSDISSPDSKALFHQTSETPWLFICLILSRSPFLCLAVDLVQNVCYMLVWCMCLCVCWGVCAALCTCGSQFKMSGCLLFLHLIPLDRASFWCYAVRQQVLVIPLPPHLHGSGFAGMSAKNKMHILTFIQEMFLTTESPLQLEYSIFTSFGL